jgi:hypothetical protein
MRAWEGTDFRPRAGREPMPSAFGGSMAFRIVRVQACPLARTPLSVARLVSGLGAKDGPRPGLIRRLEEIEIRDRSGLTLASEVDRARCH